MEVTATAKNVRVSPRKARLVVDQIKRMPPNQAVTILDFVHKSASLPIKKVIISALANARNNFGLNGETLVIKQLTIGPGRVSKRYRAVARGRAHSILKRTSHIRVVLEGEREKQTVESKGQEGDITVSEKSNIKNPNKGKGNIKGKTV